MAGGVLEWLEARASSREEAPALTTPDGGILTWRQLSGEVRGFGRGLRAHGVGRADRVAVVLPNGPDAARAFLGVAAAAACAPQNPGLREGELARAFDELQVTAAVLAPGDDGPANAVARARGIPVLQVDELAATTTGAFDPLDRDDAALVLQTSGTTSRPKTVPLAARQLLASAANVARSLELTADDRCLNLMPLFHIHGLIAAVLASLEAGGSVCCTEGFVATRVFDWFDRSEATWTTAVPTILQGILARAEGPEARTQARRLRFVRSSSSSLPPTVLAGLERALDVPVVEAYGMTEAAHQMCSNPLPPRPRKPGAVGPPAGPEVAIMDADGRRLDPGEIGEVVIRGENVFGGYSDPIEANAEAFTDGWFRTGDQGRQDEDGYLVLTGRLKELINRGGEKIAPREVDEALLAHPDVVQAVAFAVPHPRLGEEVAAAVIRRPGSTLEMRGLVDFAAERLADFKLPKRVVFVDAIPKGPTGKLQRIGLADQLGVPAFEEDAAEYVSPRTPTERTVAGLYEDVLEVTGVGATDGFFAKGGDSLLAQQLLHRVRERLGIEVPLAVLFESPAVEAVSAFCDAAHPVEPDAMDEVDDDVPEDEPAPLSVGQQALWVQQRLVGPTPALHCPHAFRLTGALDVARLTAALTEVVGAHESLRMSFPVRAAAPVSVVHPPEPVVLPVRDLTALGPQERASALQELREEAATGAFDLEAGPLTRFLLAREDEAFHVLFVTVHHAVFDGWSTVVFQNEVLARYAGESPAPPTSYRRLVRRQRRREERGALAASLDAWRARLRDLPPALAFPPDRDGDHADTAGRTVEVLVPKAGLDGLRALAREENATLFMVLLAGFAAWMSRVTGRDDVVLGTLDSGRGPASSEGVIGLFVNHLVLRLDVTGDPTFRELVSRARSMTLFALTHREVPLAALVRALKPPIVLGRNPFFDVLFQLRNLPKPRRTAGGLTMEEIVSDTGVARLDMHAEAIDEDDGLRFRVETRTALFTEDRVAGWTDALRKLLIRAASNPDARLSECTS